MPIAVLAMPLPALWACDVVMPAMAIDHAWNISHASFLTHPAPAFIPLASRSQDLIGFPRWLIA